jgi:hypothetical protein
MPILVALFCSLQAGKFLGHLRHLMAAFIPRSLFVRIHADKGRTFQSFGMFPSKFLDIALQLLNSKQRIRLGGTCHADETLHLVGQRLGRYVLENKQPMPKPQRERGVSHPLVGHNTQEVDRRYG